MYADALASALTIVMDPSYILALSSGVIIGLVIGILPGVGGTVAMALVLPFVFNMKEAAGLALVIGAGAICVTSDTITCVLFGVPGTVSSASTILDGHPLAKKGEAGRALGAAFMASLMGGLFGATCLTLTLPLARPLILLLGSPEFLMLAVLGIITVATIGGRTPVKGLVAAGLGMLVSAIGGDPGSAIFRYTCGFYYLYEGVPLIPFVMGLFAIPEVTEMVIRGTQISEYPKLGKGLIEGFKDALRHIALVIKCSGIGVYTGFLPGLGGAVANWFAYGYAAKRCKNSENFGRGDIRGVIAPESANNAVVGGELIPTLLFGVPGSSMMAILLGAFLILGIYPGRDMVTTRLDLTFSMIWSLAMANVLGAAICMVFVRPLSRITLIPIHYLAPFILMVVILGAFQTTRHWGDLLVLLGFGGLGWFMKRFGWPRPAMLVGYVLGRIVERYVEISVVRYDLEWLLRPGVIIITCIIVLSIYSGLVWKPQEISREQRT